MADVTQPVLVARGLGAGYHSERVIDGIDLAVRAGECLGVIGANETPEWMVEETVSRLEALP